MKRFFVCPRCEWESYERLRTHTYCICCDYSPTNESEGFEQIPEWAIEYLRMMDYGSQAVTKNAQKLVAI